jgi:DNA-binding transcriptional ArsR family regulator
VAKATESKTAAGGMERDATIDARLARALNHPLRARILALLNERPASPKELSEVLEVELANVSYHCRELHRLRCVEVAKREHVRGALKTTYRGTTRMMLDDTTWKQLSKETRGGISVAAVSEVIERASKALEAGTFDRREDRNVITIKMDLDEEGWKTVAELVNETYRRLADVEVEAANRAATSGEEPIRTTVSLLSYESP